MNQQILAEKKEKVSTINDALKAASTAVVVTYSGISVAEINELRHNLKKAGAKLSVHKNTLLRKAVDEDGLSELDKELKGPTAIVMAKEEGAGLEVLKEFAESHSKKFAVKGGMIGGVYCDAAKMAEFAQVGSKNNAISILLSTLQSPLVLFACALKAVAEKAPADAATAAPAAQ